MDRRDFLRLLTAGATAMAAARTDSEFGGWKPREYRGGRQPKKAK